jgi:AhpD family alkylhydroperoxidase
LIAIGVSVGTHCQPCLTVHLGKARELKVDENEIKVAIEVGYMVEKGTLTAMRKHVGLVLNQPQSNSGACCSDSNSKCCG